MRSIAGALAGLLLAGCLRADVNRCNNGAICQQDQRCTEEPIVPNPDDQHPLCGVPALVDACHGLGLQQFNSCDMSSSLKGTCHWGICDPCNDDLAGCHNDGWVGMTSHVTADLTSVWVSSVSEAYAVGDAGAAVQYDGYSWQHIPELETLAGHGTASPVKLTSIWGVSTPTELFVLAVDGRVFHYASGSWTTTTIPSQLGMTMLGGVDRTNVFAAGFRGEVWRFNGTAWSESAALGSETSFFCTAPSQHPLASAHLWGSSPTDIYLACHSSDQATGYVRHYDGSTWTIVNTVATGLYGVWGSAANDVYVVGQVGASGQSAAHLGDTGWMNLPLGFGGFTLWGSNATDVFLGGDAGIYHFDGMTWKNMAPTVVYGISGSSADNVIAVGPAGAILRYSPN